LIPRAAIPILGRERPPDLARQADIVILLDDGGGAAQSVFEVCSRINDRIHRVRSKEEIRPEWFEGVRTAAIIGGILIPQWSIDDAAQHVRAMCPVASKPSRASKCAFASRPPEKPVSSPVDPITRWHGAIIAMGFFRLPLRLHARHRGPVGRQIGRSLLDHFVDLRKQRR
jgi:hypothetical protein